MVKIYKLGIFAAIGLLMLAGAAMAVDAPHTGALAGCSGCHTLHNAAGESLTNVVGNANLCMSCHVSGGVAGNMPFATAMQPGGAFKTSHSWSGSMPNSVNDQGSNNPYGLRTDNEVADANLKTRLGIFGTCSNDTYKKKADCESTGTCSKPAYTTEPTCTANAGVWTPRTPAVWTAKVVCSTCHAVMVQTKSPWDPWITSNRKHFLRTDNNLSQMCVDCHNYMANDASVINGTATGGSTTTVSNTAAGWIANQWTGYTVKMTSGANTDVSRDITSNTATALTVSSPFNAAVVVGNTYAIMMKNSSDVKTYDGSRKSHPIAKNLTSNVANASLFVGAAPYEPDCKDAGCAQTGAPRYHMNGGSDTNKTNNIVFDSQGKIRCLTCHGMHYTDSNSATVDQP